MGRKVAGAKEKIKEKKTDHDYFKQVRDGLQGFVQMSELEEVRVVPTILTGYNRATGRGGHPLARLMLIHGPNQVGKSGLALTILESLAQAGFPCQNLDSEFASEKRWYGHLCKTPGILDKSVGDLDEVVSDVGLVMSNVYRLQQADKMPKNVGAAFVVDTLTKLMPADILESIKKEGIDKMYPIQALHISTWMKVIIPQLGRTNSSLICVLQERVNMSARNQFDKQWKMTLGTALQYDNCLRVRVTGSEKVKEKDQIIGMRCNCEVANDKVNGTIFANFSFFTSNGMGDCPIGLDLVMEAAEEAKERGWLTYSKQNGCVLDIPEVGEERVGNNMPDAVRFLRKDKEAFQELVRRLNEESIRKVKEEEYVG
jgi:RecA/RadA recombinase